jgi:hypothetical protein
MWIKKLLIPAVFILGLPFSAFPGTFGHNGLLSLWAVSGFQKPSKLQLGLRYIPEFSLALQVTESATLDAEFSFHAYGTALFEDIDDIQTDGNIKPYRIWLRYSSSQFEARIGLQKINFGSATLLRALMWFDSLDPRDPLQLTDGVYALLLRYYFVDNTNIWVWGLYGNEKAKGREILPSKKNSLEYGGRIQIPLFTGELAWTYHHRQADMGFSNFNGTNTAPENRYALDGKWDIGIGLWFEASLIHQGHELLSYPWQPWRRTLTVGLDYTFDLGNGLYVLGEHFNLATTQEAFGQGNGIDFSAVLFRYPLGLLDDITGIIYYDWENNDWYRFISWQRTYDKWRFNIIAFWNPDKFQIYPTASGNNPFVGKGIQVTVIYNY